MGIPLSFEYAPIFRFVHVDLGSDGFDAVEGTSILNSCAAAVLVESGFTPAIG